jgi:hypothetical protein
VLIAYKHLAERIEKVQDDVFEYIKKNFPDFRSDNNIRFELGEPFDNGTDARISQAVFRAVTLFEKVFNQDDVIHIYIKDWEHTTDDYTYELLDRYKLDETIMYEHDENADDAGNTIRIASPYKVRVFSCVPSTLPYKEILLGIANSEQGREPSVRQQVYFVSMRKDILFNMYDDRGCMIFAKDREKLQSLYKDFGKWLVDDQRE